VRRLLKKKSWRKRVSERTKFTGVMPMT